MNIKELGVEILAFFEGRKTYIVGALMVVVGIVFYSDAIYKEKGVQLILEGFAIMSLRAGISKV